MMLFAPNDPLQIVTDFKTIIGNKNLVVKVPVLYTVGLFKAPLCITLRIKT